MRWPGARGASAKSAPVETMRAPQSDLPISFKDVSVLAGGASIANRLTFEIALGAPTILIGPNGAGKTTLIRLAMGLAAPSSGRIDWAGSEAPRGERLAMMFQRPVMLRRSAAANVAYALRDRALGRRHRSQHVSDLLRQAGLVGLERRPARRLSGGEQQRLALARALARDPEILFLDEPTASLDPAATKAVEDIVGAIVKSGIKVVMATHDLGQARRLGGEIVFLVRGRIVERAPAERFFLSPDKAESAAFLRGDLVI
jgi:tungstate transport system ATP-binding protein